MRISATADRRAGLRHHQGGCSASPASRCAASTRWPASGTWWRWPTTASACTSSSWAGRVTALLARQADKNRPQAEEASEIRRSGSLRPNKSSRFRRTSIAPLTDDSEITQHRNPTRKSDTLLARFSFDQLDRMNDFLNVAVRIGNSFDQQIDG